MSAPMTKVNALSGVEGADRIVRLRHVQFDVIDLYFCFCIRTGRKVSVDSFDGCLVAVCAGGAADAVFQWVLRGNYEIDHVETGLIYHIFDDSEVTDVQWVE